MVWWSSFEKKYEGEVAAEADIFGGEAGAARRADLRLRVTEHNILVIAKYYARIQLPRLAELLGLTPVEVGAAASLWEPALQLHASVLSLSWACMQRACCSRHLLQ